MYVKGYNGRASEITVCVLSLRPEQMRTWHVHLVVWMSWRSKQESLGRGKVYETSVYTLLWA